jgi:2'-5' RNA ligase
MKYGVAIFPSKKLQDLANSYRKRYDPHYALIPPHLTLKHLFEASDTEIKDITRTLSLISKKYNPFTIQVKKVKSFQPVSNTIYFKVEPVAELEGLYEDLYTEVPGEKSEYPFVPHITIGQKLSNDEHSDVLGQLDLLGIDHEEIIDRFHLLYQLDNGSWTVCETFHLGKE